MKKNKPNIHDIVYHGPAGKPETAKKQYSRLFEEQGKQNDQNKS